MAEFDKFFEGWTSLLNSHQSGEQNDLRKTLQILSENFGIFFSSREKKIRC